MAHWLAVEWHDRGQNEDDHVPYARLARRPLPDAQDLSNGKGGHGFSDSALTQRQGIGARQRGRVRTLMRGVDAGRDASSALSCPHGAEPLAQPDDHRVDAHSSPDDRVFKDSWKVAHQGQSDLRFCRVSLAFSYLAVR